MCSCLSGRLKFAEFTPGYAEQVMGELWALDLAVGVWTQLPAAEVPARFGHVCVGTLAPAPARNPDPLGRKL